jgi:UDP-N-acetylmuramyl pentapeptide phosphotransferase/UDP-N-acetylglucosamine-1-phosphate transferase
MNFYSPLIAVLVTYFLIRFMLSSKTFIKIQDAPNERSLHSAPVPRFGGVGLMLGILSGGLLVPSSLVWWVGLPTLLLFAVSLIDDIKSLPVKQRLLVHVIAALILVLGSGLFSQQGILVSAAVLLFTVWMTNLYNFMDGSDGLAAGMALFGFGMYGVAALLAHNTPLALLSLCITAAAAGLLYFNFHPAKIFMGDAGSIPLGFLAAAIGLWGWQQGSWAIWFPMLVFSPFIIDASVTLLKRIVGGARVAEAHREHYYQRLILMGWGHRNVALAEYVLMLVIGASALIVQYEPFPWRMLLVWCLVYLILMVLLDVRWKNFTRGKNV